MTATRIVRYRAFGGLGWAELQSDGSLRPLGGPPVSSLAEVELLAPVEPTKIVGIGSNYRAHVLEMGKTIPSEPLLFLKPATAVIASGAAIVRPAEFSQVHYEGELAVIFGRSARHVPAERALEYVAGYCCANDVSVRDLQQRDGQFTRAKGFDTFAPLGPCLARGLDPSDLPITTRVDGQVRQQATTADMIFSVPELIAAVTRVMTMLPGDAIFTGTPSGVGNIAAGNVIEIEIGGIGTLRNPVVTEGPVTEG